MAYKIKRYTRINPITGRKEYQSLLMGKSGEKDITYRTSFQRSRAKEQDEISRFTGSVEASQTGSPVFVKQDYGSRKVQINPSEDIAKSLEEGGQIRLPSDYDEISYEGGIKKIRKKSQTGIRKKRSLIKRYASNMLDPEYNIYTDETPTSLVNKYKGM